MHTNGSSRGGGTLVLVVATLLAVGGTCLACTSGLIAIPTAETVPHGEYDIEPQIDGVMSGLRDDTWILNTQFGLTPRLAAGVDFQWADGDDGEVLLNFQYLLVPSTDVRPAVAVGIHSLGVGPEHGRFLVATQELDALRVHAGVESIENESQWFVGADYAVSERLVLMGDYTAGSENCSSVGFCWHQREGFDVQLGVLFPNSSSADTRFSLAFVLTGPIQGR
ncbi:MAG: hypothetical protein KBC96_04825 [Armatimonadetes bacterium]|nr:hypothetical protein [Armatimonadota bacterium]